MVLALKTREPAVRPRASLSPGRDPHRPISAQTNWCRVRDLASQARHKMDGPNEDVRYREAWSTPVAVR